MSIREIVATDKKFKGLTMSYEDGGKIQVFKLGDKEVRLGPMASTAEVIAAFEEKE
jgi:hypothetical protein